MLAFFIICFCSCRYNNVVVLKNHVNDSCSIHFPYTLPIGKRVSLKGVLTNCAFNRIELLDLKQNSVELYLKNSSFCIYYILDSTYTHLDNHYLLLEYNSNIHVVKDRFNLKSNIKELHKMFKETSFTDSTIIHHIVEEIEFMVRRNNVSGDGW